MSDSKKIYNICIISAAGDGDTGHEAILAGIVYSLGNEIPNARVTTLCIDPEYIQKTYDLETVPGSNNRWGRIKTIFKAFKEADLIVWSGGLPFYDSAHLGKLFRFGLARLLRKPMMFYGVGALPIRSKKGKFITQYIINWNAAVTVRDKSSKRLLIELEVKKDIILTADPAFLLQPVLSERVEKRLSEISGISQKAPLIGICIGTISNYYWHRLGLSSVSEETISRFKLSIARVADFIINELGQVLFIPMRISPQEHDNDCDTFKDIVELMKRKDRVKVMDGARYTAQELAGVIGKLDLLLSGRFHALIYAALSSVPVVALGCGTREHGINNRIYDFMESIGQGKLVCDMGDFEYNDCISKLHYAWSHRDAISQEINQKVEVLKEKALLNAKMANELLLSKSRK